MTFGCVQSGLSAGSGSVVNTSSVAASKRAVVERGQNVGLDLQPAAAGVDHHRPAELAVAREAPELRRFRMPRVCRRQRQQADEDVGAREEALELRCRPQKVSMPGIDSSVRLQPATSKPIRASTSAASCPSTPSPMMPTRRSRAGLAASEPQTLPLAVRVIALAAMMHQHVQHHVFGHALGQVVVRDAHQRHRRQRQVGDNRVDAGAEIEDHLEIGKVAERAGLRLPYRRVANAAPDRSRHPE